MKRNVLVLIVVVLGLIMMQPALARGWSYIHATWHLNTPNDGLEGTLLHEAQIVKRGEPLYRPIVPQEFVSAPYTPFHTIMLSLFPFDQTDPFANGRMISIVAFGLIALLLGANVATHGNRWLGILAAAFWLAFPPAQLWTTRIKPDVLALCLTTGGLYLGSLRRGRWADWAAVVFALAFLTKQTALIAPFAVGLNLLITDWRRALRYGLIYGLAIGVPYFAFDLPNNRLMTAHVWGLHRSEWWDFNLFWKYVRLLGWYLPLLGLSLLAIKHVRQQFAYRQAMLYAVFAPVTLYAAGEIGAHHNHLFETMTAWIVAGGISAGLLIDQFRSSASMKRGLAVSAITLLLVQAWLMRTTPAWYRGEFVPLDLARYVIYIQSKQGDVLLDNPGLAISAGKPIVFDDPSTMGPAIESGVWDPSMMHDKIRTKHFSLIMLEVDVTSETIDATGRWTPATLALVGEHYRLEFADTLFAYVPK